MKTENADLTAGHHLAHNQMVLQQNALALMHLLSVLHELQQDWNFQMLNQHQML